MATTKKNDLRSQLREDVERETRALKLQQAQENVEKAVDSLQAAWRQFKAAKDTEERSTVEAALKVLGVEPEDYR